MSAPPVADPGPYREPDWEWMVRLLGRKVVVVDRADDKIVFVTETNRNGQLAPELLAFLSFRTDRSAAVDEIRDALWAAKITANLKKTAGLNPAEREQARRRGDGLVSEETARRLARAARQYLRDDVLVYDGGLWTLGPQVVTDIALLEHRLDYAQIAPADVAWPVLRDALAQISAVPFADSALEVWADASHTTMRVHEVIGEAGVVAAQLALELGRYDDGLWACDQAQIANPINEQVEVLAYDLEAARHNFDGIRHRYQAMITRLDAIHDEPDPATQSRYNKYMLRRSAG